MDINLHYKNFILVAIISCFLSVITTLGIHSNLFDPGELSSEERLRLFENTTYLANRFWVIVHCLLVVISMLGFLLIQFKKSPGFTLLGFVCFTVFSFTEIFRQMFVLFYLNNLRKAYINTSDAQVLDMIQTNMDHAGFIGFALFGLFIVSFALGNICYGISLIGGDKRDTVLTYLLIFWGVGNLAAFGNIFWESKSLGEFIEYFSIIYQPIMRLLVALWMLYKLREIRKIYRAASPFQETRGRNELKI